MSEPARTEVARVTGEVVHVGASSLMDVIGRAAADPNTNVDKLERMLGMYERITAREAEQAYHDAMNACQAEMDPIRTDAHNPQTKSRYASYPALDRACRPIYTRHGFSLSYGTADGAPQDWVRVVCRIAHRGGHKEIEHVDMPADGKGAKGGDVMTKTHATGSALSYGQRYLLKLIFNISVGDDDGNRASRPVHFVTATQARQINDLIRETSANRDLLLKYVGANSVEEIPASEFQGVVRKLEAKRGAK
jgi:hypothetical protein